MRGEQGRGGEHRAGPATRREMVPYGLEKAECPPYCFLPLLFSSPLFFSFDMNLFSMPSTY